MTVPLQNPTISSSSTTSTTFSNPTSAQTDSVSSNHSAPSASISKSISVGNSSESNSIQEMQRRDLFQKMKKSMKTAKIIPRQQLQCVPEVIERASFVHEGHWNTSDGKKVRVAVKKVDLDNVDDRCVTSVVTEMETLQKLRHKNLVRVYGYLMDEETYTVGFVMQRLHGNLAEYLEKRNLSTEEALECAMDIATGVSYLHDNGLVWNQLNPSNVLYKVDRATKKVAFKLCNFGSASVRSSHTDLRSDSKSWREWDLASDAYIAPERLGNGTQKDMGYSQALDIYALAVLINCLFSGQMPYSDFKETFDLVDAVVDKDKRPTLAVQMSDDLKEHIEKCWHANPLKRPNIVHVRHALNQFRKELTVQQQQPERGRLSGH